MLPLAITWFGHSTFLIRTPGGKRLLFDPWLQGNPACPDALKKPPLPSFLAHDDHKGWIEFWYPPSARDRVAPLVSQADDLRAELGLTPAAELPAASPPPHPAAPPAPPAT